VKVSHLALRRSCPIAEPLGYMVHDRKQLDAVDRTREDVRRMELKRACTGMRDRRLMQDVSANDSNLSGLGGGRWNTSTTAQ
jgi:hypothetical protein